ncbi:MAG: ArsR family transcriptional regulator [Nitrosopumilaceae archaeon]
MQALFQKRKIEDDERKDAILEILADKYCRDIIEITMEKPKSAMDIAADTKIPISTVYRRLQALYDSKLMAISGMISDDGKKLFLYKSKIKSLCASFTGNYIEVEVVPNIPSVAKE